MITCFDDVKGTGIRQLGRVRVLVTASDTEEHRHPGRFEVIACLKGRGRYCYGAKVMECLPGTAVLSAPGKRHRLRNNDKSLETLYAEFDLSAEMGLSEGERTALRRALMRRSGKVLTLSPRLKDSLLRLLELAEVQSRPKPPPFVEVELRAAMLEMLLALATVPDSARTVSRDAPLVAWLEQVRRFPARDYPLKATARTLGMLPPAFSSAVKHATGYTPHAFVLKCRVERAKDLLKEKGRSVGFVADALRFCGSQHFAYVFRKFTGKGKTEGTK